jgi:hypothetical protein
MVGPWGGGNRRAPLRIVKGGQLENWMVNEQKAWGLYLPSVWIHVFNICAAALDSWWTQAWAHALWIYEAAELLLLGEMHSRSCGKRTYSDIHPDFVCVPEDMDVAT